MSTSVLQKQPRVLFLMPYGIIDQSTRFQAVSGQRRMEKLTVWMPTKKLHSTSSSRYDSFYHYTFHFFIYSVTYNVWCCIALCLHDMTLCWVSIKNVPFPWFRINKHSPNKIPLVHGYFKYNTPNYFSYWKMHIFALG